MIDTIILDRGHATLDSNGKYVTPGKQFTFPDKLHVYEGRENQKYVECLAKKLKLLHFNIEYTVNPDDPTDPSLITRVLKANTSKSRKTSLYLSIHNNAGGGIGTEVFTSVGQTLSDKFAQNIILGIKKELPNRVIRSVTTDGDLDKEEQFYVLRKTNMPSVLLEYGFFDNRIDYNYLSNPEIIEKLCEATVNGIVNTLITLYGQEAWETRNY